MSTNDFDFNYDDWRPEANFVIEEAKGTSSNGKSIIGKFNGEFFVPNGTSRNKRFYSESLWKKQLARAEVKEMLSDRRMLGTISHDQPLDDKSLLDEKVSHIVTKLEIRDGKGFGEAEILDTVAGRALKTYMSAGVKLFTSSRANGKFDGERNGVPAVDEDNYFLQTFDIVQDPGFRQAKPSLAEAVEQLLIEENNNNNKQPKPPKKNGDPKMELVEQLARDKSKLQDDVSNLSNELETQKSNNVILQSQNDNLKENAEKMEKDLEVLEDYIGLGDPKEIKEKLEDAEKITEAFKDVGEADKIKTALEESKKLIKEYQEVGSSPAKITEALELAQERIQAFEALVSTPEKLAQFADQVEAIMKEQDEVKASTEIKELADELKVSEEKIAKLYGKLDSDEIREFFKGEAEKNENRSRWVKPNTSKDKNLSEGNENNEDESNKSPFKSNAKMLMESFKR